MNDIKIDKSWTLFLDRDGVINKEIEGQYILRKEDFYFLDGVLDALAIANQMFHKIVIVTNQRCIGKGILKEEELNSIHDFMKDKISNHNGRIDAIYFATSISDEDLLRKPNTGMGFLAKEECPTIDFQKSIMVGNTYSDIEFANRLDMFSVYIHGKKIPEDKNVKVDFFTDSLLEFIQEISIYQKS